MPYAVKRANREQNHLCFSGDQILPIWNSSSIDVFHSCCFQPKCWHVSLWNRCLWIRQRIRINSFYQELVLSSSSITYHLPPIYIKMNVCLSVCLFVCSLCISTPYNRFRWNFSEMVSTLRGRSTSTRFKKRPTLQVLEYLALIRTRLLILLRKTVVTSTRMERSWCSSFSGIEGMILYNLADFVFKIDFTLHQWIPLEALLVTVFDDFVVFLIRTLPMLCRPNSSNKGQTMGGPRKKKQFHQKNILFSIRKGHQSIALIILYQTIDFVRTPMAIFEGFSTRVSC